MNRKTVLIIGAGFAGIGTAIRLLQQGIDDFLILERSTDVGGTWRDNSYPGAACDVPSLLYSFGFEQNPNWSRAYSGSSEILEYIKGIVDKHALRRFIRFGVTVTGLHFDDETGTWTAETDEGSNYYGRSVVMANGPLSNASFPDIRGLDTYTGHKILSARWDHDYDMTDKRVAVIGTGASAVQIIPELVKVARSVKVFQRTPGWVLPKPDFPHPEWTRSAFSRLPVLQRAARQAWFWGHEIMAVGMVWNTPATSAIQWIAKANLRRQVKERWLRRQLTPDFRPGCKRMLMTSDYYPALQRENCKLISWPIATISPTGIRTADGVEHELDCIVFATGFDVCKAGTPFPITGSHGRDLAEEWSTGARAYKSVSVSGYPNLFFTFGPNSGPGHNSALVYMESEIDYIVKAIRLIIDHHLHSIDVEPDRQDHYHKKIQRRLAGTTWNSGCKSWYLTEDGYNGTMFPGFATEFARQLARVETTDYVMTPQLSEGVRSTKALDGLDVSSATVTPTGTAEGPLKRAVSTEAVNAVNGNHRMGTSR